MPAKKKKKQKKRHHKVPINTMNAYNLGGKKKVKHVPVVDSHLKQITEVNKTPIKIAKQTKVKPTSLKQSM